MKRRLLSLILVFALCLTLMPQMMLTASGADPIVVADSADGELPYDAVFLSDLHNGVGGYLGLKQMMDELKNEGQNPRVLGHGGDYVEDSRGGDVDWKTQVYDVISGFERDAFPEAEQVYTMGNHDWETGTFNNRTDKEAAFKQIFGFDRAGLAYSDDEMEIYMIGSQNATGSGGGGEAFDLSDISDFDRYLSSRLGTDKVIFLQTHWPAHSSYNFRQRVVENSGKLIDVINSYGSEMDIVWLWGHNHYEDTMRYTILQPGDEILYSANADRSTWGNPVDPKYKAIKFIYANVGCMNDMWYLQSGSNNTSAADNYRGPSACLSVAVDSEEITFTYNRIKKENGAWVFSHDADLEIHNHNVVMKHPATVTIPRGEGGAAPAYDLSALEAAIQAAEELDKSIYTDASVAALEAALAEAREVMITGGQHAIDDAAANLQKAIDAMVLKPLPVEGNFVRARSIKPGSTYVIVADDAYALNDISVQYGTYSNGSTTLGATKVTVEDDRIVSDVDAGMLWTFKAADGVQDAIDGEDQYFLFTQDGQQLLRRSGSTKTAPLSLGTFSASSPQYATFSLYQRADGSYTMYVNSYRSSDYPFTLKGVAEGFNAPGVSRSEWKPETYGSSIRLYEDYDGGCLHEWEKTVTAATCTEGGFTTYTCALCGEVYVDRYTAALGHSYRNVVTAATCTEPGYTTHTCTRCGESYTDRPTAALGHSYRNTVTAPTCTEPGYTTHTCSRCGDRYTDTPTAALGHSYRDTVTAPTCTEPGCTTHICSRCGDSYSETTTPALGHSYRDTVTAPTCTEPGCTIHTCTRCGDSYSDTTTPALGHSYQDTVTAPTCTEPGYTTHTCNRCGNSYSDSTTPAMGHQFVQVVDDAYLASEATTESPALYYMSCSVCGAKDEKNTFPYGEPLETPEVPVIVAIAWSWNIDGDNTTATLRLLWSNDQLETHAAAVRQQSETEQEATYYAFTDVDGTKYESTKTVKKAYTVNVINGTFVSAAKTSYNFGEEIVVRANAAPAGQAFNGWYIGDALVCTTETYTRRVTDNLTLEARYGETQIDPQAAVTASNTSRIYDAASGKYKTTLRLDWSLPTGYTLVQAGMYRAYANAPMTAEAVVASGSVSRSTLKTASGSFASNISMGASKNDYDLYYVGYITYRDKTGAEKTVYTPVGCNKKI